ncbi:Bulb-type lectin domain superfamily [Fusarium oxysporum f. sp. vasinfectum]|nr:Bulb-type lectin domain superfamily [Fusarium oxysporum f. sp. vasinfectum]
MGYGTLENGDWLMVGMSIFSKDRSVELPHARRWQARHLLQQPLCLAEHRPTDQQRKGRHHAGRCDKNGKATWHTNTAAPSGDNKTFLSVQDDGNLVLYKNGGATPIWSSKSNK